MIYIVYAHNGEIESFAGRLREKTSLFKLVRAQGAEAGQALEQALNRETSGPPDLILNVGFAGALNQDLDLGQVVTITQAEWAVMQQTQPTSPKLYTATEPVAGIEARDALRESTGADIVDMEAAHLLAVAVSAGIPFACVKVVSDFADGSARKDAVGQRAKWSKILGQAVLDMEGAFWMSR